MNAWVYWILAGFGLLIFEMGSGTFYLLVLGLAAFAGGLAAWLGATVAMQAGLAGTVALAGVVLVWKLRSGDAGPVSTNTLDIGERVTLDRWVDRSAGLARVRYRDAVWDARVVGPEAAPDAPLYICNVAGNVLEVSGAAPR